MDHVRVCFQVGTRRACRVLALHRSMYLYRSRRPEQALLRKRIREIAEMRVRYGYRRIHILLQREGWSAGRTRVYRLYRLEGLQMRHKPPRRRVIANFVTTVRRLLHPMTAGRWIGCMISFSMEGGSGS